MTPLRRTCRCLAGTLVPLALINPACSPVGPSGVAAMPAPTAMPPNPPGTIDDAIAALDAALAQHAPQTLAALSPGLSDAQIDAALAGTGVALPAELRALYRWHDGSPPASSGWQPLFANAEFAPLAQSLANHQGAQSNPWPVAYTKHWFDVFPDPAGDGVKLDLSRTNAQGAWFDVFLEDGAYTFFPSLKSVLLMIAEGFNTGVFTEDAAGRVQTDFFRLDPLMRKHGQAM